MLMRYGFAILAFVGSLCAAACAYGEVGQRILFIPRFDGANDIGQRVAETLNIQILRRLRANDGDRSFGRAKLLWSSKDLPEFTEQGAERLGLQDLAHLVLWGRAYEGIDGVVVQSHLTVTPILYEFTSDRVELWSISVRVRDQTEYTLTLDLPRSTFALGPILLSKEAVSLYHGLDSIPLFTDRDLKSRVGVAGREFTVLQMEKDRARIHRDGSVFGNQADGWIHISGLLAEENQVSLFTGSVLRIIRSDWAGAADLLDMLVADRSLPYDLLTDALLLRGLADEKRHRSGKQWFERAHELNPLYDQACKYLVQSYLAADGGSNVRDVEAVRSYYSECAPFFSADDQWFQVVTKVVAGL